MPFEIINNNNTTPHRVLAMLQTYRHRPRQSRRGLEDLLQPDAIADKSEKSGAKKVSAAVYTLCLSCGFIVEEGNKQKTSHLNVPAESLQTVAMFRRYLQETLLKCTQPTDDNYMLNQFTAWYIAQDERILSESGSEMVARFNEDLSTDGKKQFTDHTMLPAWHDWAIFLGWGWSYGSGGSERLVPDVSLLLEDWLEDWLKPNERLAVDNAIERIGNLFPQLDGGALYRMCWQASRGSVAPSTLSLALSTGLRVLEKQGTIRLLNLPDAPMRRTLFPTQTYTNVVTHIERVGVV